MEPIMNLNGQLAADAGHLGQLLSRGFAQPAEATKVLQQLLAALGTDTRDLLKQ